MELAINGKVAGRLTFELFEESSPLTCKRFKSLLTGGAKELAYKGSSIHRVWHNYALQGGDIPISTGDGQACLQDEDLTRVHTGAGLLGMAKVAGVPKSATTQFYITLSSEPLPHLDGQYVIFGRVKSGRELLSCIDELAKLKGVSLYKDPFTYATTETHLPDNTTVTVSDCGIIERVILPRVPCATLPKKELSSDLQQFLKRKLAEVDSNPQVLVLGGAGDLTRDNSATTDGL